MKAMIWKTPAGIGDMTARHPSQVPCHLDQKGWDMETVWEHFELVQRSGTEAVVSPYFEVVASSGKPHAEVHSGWVGD
jgi:hypothetical protein